LAVKVVVAVAVAVYFLGTVCVTFFIGMVVKDDHMGLRFFF
jgi:hypothetical protein